MHARLVSTLVGVPVVALVAGGVAAPLMSPGGDVAQAEATTVALANALVAAVVSISDAAPPDAGPEQIKAGSQAVSLIFAECNREYRLIDASGAPIGANNVAHGAWEMDALDAVVNGAPVVQEVVGGQLRTVVPLTNDMHPNCMTCHSNYADFVPGTVIGAASLKINIEP